MRRAASLAFGLLFVALALTAGCSARPEIPQPEPHRFLQQATGCDFNGDQGFKSDLYIESLGFVLASPANAIDCLNQIQVGYDFAYQSVVNLGKLFNSSYVFVAIAAKPTDGVPLSSIVFNYSSDVPGSLNKLANSWTVNQPVGLADLTFGVNSIFLKLHDAHVTYSGSGSGTTGTILGNAMRNATRGTLGLGDRRIYLLDNGTGEAVYSIAVQKVGKVIQVSAEFLTQSRDSYFVTMTSINGKSPFDWFVNLANLNILPLDYKPTGTRVNQLLTAFASLLISNVGDITKLPEANVVWADGTTSTLTWGVTFPASGIVSASRLSRLQQDANTIGVPLKALQRAAQAYQQAEDVTVSGVDPTPSVTVIKREESRRRRAQQTLSLPSSLTLLNDTDGSTYGFYYFNKTRAVLKLSGFGFDYTLLPNWWPVFVAAAKTRGVTNLLIDLTGNGGGIVQNGIALALGLYPSAQYGDLGLRYDRIMGQDAVYAYSNKLRPKDVNKTLTSLIGDPSYFQGRLKFLTSTNTTEQRRLIKETKSLIAALNALFASASKTQDQSCQDSQGNTITCRDQWQASARRLSNALDSISANGLTASNFRMLVFQYLPDLLQLFWPYTGAPGDKGSDPYASPRLIRRGGKTRNYTAQFDLNGYLPTYTAQSFIPDLTSTKPQFKRILAVSDGYCGSTCDTFSRTAWFYSRRNPTAPVFKFLTFGGTGMQSDSSPTAYPGGNVNSNDFLTASWAYAIMGQLVAEWVGWQGLYDNLSTWSKLLPVFPAFLDTFTPQYTQSEVYNAGALGSDSIPMEYLRIPTDYYAPVWYTATSVPESPSDPTDLPALYNVGLSVLDSMPSPKQTATNEG